jgi:hypothetical protein
VQHRQPTDTWPGKKQRASRGSGRHPGSLQPSPTGASCRANFRGIPNRIVQSCDPSKPMGATGGLKPAASPLLRSSPQKPVTFFRQVLSLCEYRELLDNPLAAQIYPPDAIEVRVPQSVVAVTTATVLTAGCPKTDNVHAAEPEGSHCPHVFLIAHMCFAP